jgi:hypothetical protein
VVGGEAIENEICRESKCQKKDVWVLELRDVVVESNSGRHCSSECERDREIDEAP